MNLRSSQAVSQPCLTTVYHKSDENDPMHLCTILENWGYGNFVAPHILDPIYALNGGLTRSVTLVTTYGQPTQSVAVGPAFPCTLYYISQTLSDISRGSCMQGRLFVDGGGGGAQKNFLTLFTLGYTAPQSPSAPSKVKSSRIP